METKKNKLINTIDTKQVEKLAKKLNKPVLDSEREIKISVKLPETMHKLLKIYCIENNTDIQKTGFELFEKLLIKD